MKPGSAPPVSVVGDKPHAVITVVLPGLGPTGFRPGLFKRAFSIDDLPIFDLPRKATSGTIVSGAGWFCFRHSSAVHSRFGRKVSKNHEAAASCCNVGGGDDQYSEKVVLAAEEALVAWKERRRFRK